MQVLFSLIKLAMIAWFMAQSLSLSFWAVLVILSLVLQSILLHCLILRNYSQVNIFTATLYPKLWLQLFSSLPRSSKPERWSCYRPRWSPRVFQPVYQWIKTWFLGVTTGSPWWVMPRHSVANSPPSIKPRIGGSCEASWCWGSVWEPQILSALASRRHLDETTYGWPVLAMWVHWGRKKHHGKSWLGATSILGLSHVKFSEV